MAKRKFQNSALQRQLAPDLTVVIGKQVLVNKPVVSMKKTNN